MCDVALGQCVAPPVTDAGCSSNTACVAPTPFCGPAQRCVGCLKNADCGVGQCDVRSGQCVPSASDTCAGLSKVVEIAQGTLTLRGSTANAANDVSLSCAIAGSSGPDAVFGLKVGARKRLTAVVKPVDSTSGFAPVVGVRTLCGEVSAEVACGFVSRGGTSARAVAEGLAPGDAFVWVDSESEVGGEFELELTFDDAPEIDSCAAPGLLRVTDALDLTGETTGLADELSASCGGLGAPDAVYRLTLETPRRVKLEAVGLAGFKPVVSLRSACLASSSERACAAALGTTNTSLVELPSLDRGDYFVIIDGPSSGPAAGRFRLRVTLLDPVPAPTNDTCETAEALTVSGPGPSGALSVQGDTSRAKNDAIGCDGTGPDLLYALELAQPQRLRVLVTPLSGSRLQPVLYLRRAVKCQSNVPRDQLACATAGQPGFPTQLDVPRLETGTWYLFVDGRSGTSGAFDLTLELSEPPTPPVNDGCATSTPLMVAQGPVFLANETTAGASVNALTCSAPDFSPDVAYSFTLPSRQSLSIDARALTGSRLWPIVSVKHAGTCTQTAYLPSQQCLYPDPQVPERAATIIPVLEPGPYVLWVSGDVATQGAFSLRLSPGQPLAPPANDGCSGSLSMSLSLGAVVSGDTRGASSTTDGRCGLPLGANGEYGNDVAYTFQVTTARPSVLITVTPDRLAGELMRPVIYVRGGPASGNTCTASGPTLGCQAAADYGSPVTLQLSGVQPGTYTLWVDGAGQSSGEYSLSIQ